MLEKLKGSFNKSVAAVSVKSESFVESSRTKTAITNAEKQKEEELDALGRACYQAWKNGEMTIESFLERFERIKDIEEKISAYHEHLEEIKKEEARILGEQNKQPGSFCIACGKALPAGSRFCDKCGTPVRE